MTLTVVTQSGLSSANRPRAPVDHVPPAGATAPRQAPEVDFRRAARSHTPPVTVGQLFRASLLVVIGLGFTQLPQADHVTGSSKPTAVAAPAQ